MFNLISDFGLRGGSSFYREYPEISGTYPKKGPETIVLETVVP